MLLLSTQPELKRKRTAFLPGRRGLGTARKGQASIVDGCSADESYLVEQKGPYGHGGGSILHAHAPLYPERVPHEPLALGKR